MFCSRILRCSVGNGRTRRKLEAGSQHKYTNPDVEKLTRSLESEKRVIYAHRKEIIALLELESGLDVADIGAGTGFFSRSIAATVGPDGTVYAVDVAENFIENIKDIAEKESLPNLKPVLSEEKSTTLPAESIDVAFICDTYHHLEFPYHTMDSVHQALRPNGILVIIDYERVKGICSKHTFEHVRCGKGTVTDEVKDAGFDFLEEIPMMEQQWIRKFKKRS